MNRVSRAMAEECDRIRDRLAALPRSGHEFPGATVIGFVARTSGEGVTTLAAGVAASYGRVANHRVVLVEANARHGDAVAMFGLAPRVMGPDGWRCPVDEQVGYVQHAPKHGIDVLTIGRDPEGGVEDERARDVLCGALRARYDTVVLDAGSLEAETALAWGRLTALTVLVVDTTRTTVEALERVRHQYQRSPSGLTAVVLNKRRRIIPDFVYRRLF